jgi:hypothetical protein
MASAPMEKNLHFLMIIVLLWGIARPGFAQTVPGTSSPGIRDTARKEFSQPIAKPFETITGPLPDTIKAQSGPFLVTGDIEVPIGRTVTLEPGTVFLFKNLTGLHVQGRLIAVGTKEHPIVFSSENDRTVNAMTSLYPNPYDWNGIYIHADATGTVMNYCNVLYSVYGIVSETKFIRIDPVLFRMNGKSNLVIDGKDQQVGEMPFRYVLSVNDVRAEGVPVKLLADPHEIRRNIIRYAGFSVLLAGAAGGIYSGIQWKKYQDDLSRISTDDPSVIHSVNESDWIAFRDKRDNNRMYTAIASIAAVIGGTGFIWSFTF